MSQKSFLYKKTEAWSSVVKAENSGSFFAYELLFSIYSALSYKYIVFDLK